MADPPGDTSRIDVPQPEQHQGEQAAVVVADFYYNDNYGEHPSPPLPRERSLTIIATAVLEHLPSGQPSHVQRGAKWLFILCDAAHEPTAWLANTQEACQLEAPRRILHAMDRWSGHEGVQRWSLAAMGSLLTTAPRLCRASFLTWGGLERLLNALSRHGASPQVRWGACSCLWMLLPEARFQQDEFDDASFQEHFVHTLHGIPFTIDMMQQFAYDELVQEFGCSVLSSLAVRWKDDIVDEGGTQAAHQIMETITCPRVRRTASELLQRIAPETVLVPEDPWSVIFSV